MRRCEFALSEKAERGVSVVNLRSLAAELVCAAGCVEIVRRCQNNGWERWDEIGDC